jgi:hypothetical protein
MSASPLMINLEGYRLRRQCIFYTLFMDKPGETEEVMRNLRHIRSAVGI